MQSHVIILPIDGINAIKQCNLYHIFFYAPLTIFQIYKKKKTIHQDIEVVIINNKRVCLLWFHFFSYTIKGFRCNALKSFLMSFHF